MLNLDGLCHSRKLIKFKSSVNEDVISKSRFGGFIKFTAISGAKTQKAKGVLFLQNQKGVVNSEFGWSVPKHLLFSAGQTWTDASFNYPVFIRPCPTVPRHGFVDSIICESSEKLNEISVLTNKVEPEAELLITKPVDCYYNVIINKDILTFAGGNDGATSGKNCKYFYLADDGVSAPISLDQDLLQEGEVPFYELVISKKGVVNLVQVRSAPGTPRVKDYIPAKVEIKEIIKAEGDLLDWEQKLKTVNPTTTIIDHTSGSLSSHYAIHAIVNQIPIFTTYCPQIGDTIEPTVVDPGITELDKENFFKAFVAGYSSTVNLNKSLKFGKAHNTEKITTVMRDILKLSLATLHNYSAIALNRDYELLGLVLGLFVRTTFSVSAGEARYINSKTNSSNIPVETKEFLTKLPSERYPSYEFMFKRETAQSLHDIGIIYHIFNDLSWSGSYGGKKWANCTRSSINLFNACVNQEISQVVELFNRVINEEHNGGKYLNKVIDIGEFDLAALDPAKFSLKNLASIVDILYTSWGYVDANKEALEVVSSTFVPIKMEVKTNSKYEFKVGEGNYKIVYIGGIVEFFQPEAIPNPIHPYGNYGCKSCEVVVEDQSGLQALYTIPLPKVLDFTFFPDYSSQSKVSFFSIPYRWTLNNGTVVMMKSYLTSKLKPMVSGSVTYPGGNFPAFSAISKIPIIHGNNDDDDDEDGDDEYYDDKCDGCPTCKPDDYPNKY